MYLYEPEAKRLAVVVKGAIIALFEMQFVYN
jgi:hypothetical protein